jgi:hypothetical protein
MRNTLLTVHQHGGDDVTCKPRIPETSYELSMHVFVCGMRAVRLRVFAWCVVKSLGVEGYITLCQKYKPQRNASTSLSCKPAIKTDYYIKLLLFYLVVFCLSVAWTCTRWWVQYTIRGLELRRVFIWGKKEIDFFLKLKVQVYFLVFTLFIKVI